MGLDSEISTSEDEEMTAEEQLEINTVLATLGASPLAMQAIPISMVSEENNFSNEIHKEHIRILSDGEDGGLSESAPAQNEANPIAAESRNPNDNNPPKEVHLAKFDPMSAMVVYSKEVNPINHFLV